MRCDICKNFLECEALKEFQYIIAKMDIEDCYPNKLNSLRDDMYIVIAKHCKNYIEEV